MSAYTVETHGESFYVKELSTNNSVGVFTKQDRMKALRQAKFLNRGGGFAGWTPDFISEKYKLSS